MPDVIFRHVPGMAKASPVPVLDAASLSEERFVNDYVAHSRPCVIKGAVNQDVTDTPFVRSTYAFAGRELDSESGYYYLRARYYDPQISFRPASGTPAGASAPTS